MMDSTTPKSPPPPSKKGKHLSVRVKPDSLTSALVKIRDDGRWKVLDYHRDEDGGWTLKLLAVEN